MKIFYVTLALLSGLMTAQASHAATIIGPLQDLKETVEGSNIYIELETLMPLLWPPWAKKDKITIQIGTRDPHGRALNVKGIAYDAYDNPDFTGNVLMTTIYGIDLDPTGSGLETTGLDTEFASVVSFSDEQFIGVSGTIYHGVPLGTPTLADLPMLLPGYDLSPFQGDPTSIVYVFQTLAPAADFVPESSSVVLLGLGALCLATYSWNSKRRRPSLV